MDQYEVAIDKLRTEVARLKSELQEAHARIASLEMDLADRVRGEADAKLELSRARLQSDGFGTMW